MRTPGLAAILMVFAIAACSDVAAPIAAGPDSPSLQKNPWMKEKKGGQTLSDNKQKCDAHDRHWGRGRPHGHWGWHDRNRRSWSFRGHDGAGQSTGDCGAATTATISGTVTNDGVGAASYPVSLLKGDGSAVVASTTTDATGAYAFANVAAGAYLVCEDNPFTEAHTFLGETRPATGTACPSSAYAPRGFSLTAAGAALSGNNFSNMRLD
jgi:hypothetical protein